MYDFVPYREYQELDNFEKCVADRLTAYTTNMLLQVNKRDSVLGGSSSQDFRTLSRISISKEDRRDVLLAVGGIENIIDTLRDPTAEHQHVLASCAEENPKESRRYMPKAAEKLTSLQECIADGFAAAKMNEWGKSLPTNYTTDKEEGIKMLRDNILKYRGMDWIISQVIPQQSPYAEMRKSCVGAQR